MQDKGKMSLWDFVSTWDSEDENPDKNWSKHWEKVVPEILKDEKLTSKHAGDCTKESSPCMLCMIENMLAEYREYYFTKGHRLLGRDVEARQWVDIQTEQPEVGQMVLCVTYPELREGKPDFVRYVATGEFAGLSEVRTLPMIGKIFSLSKKGIFKNCMGLPFNASHWLPLDILPPLPNKEDEGI